MAESVKHVVYPVALIGQGAWGEGSTVSGLQSDSNWAILSFTLSCVL